MLRPLILLLALLASACSIQAQDYHFSRVDAYADKVDSDDPVTLAHLLTDPFDSEPEKIRSVFRWITTHISYRTYSPLAWRTAVISPARIYSSDDSGELKPLDQRVAIRVLQERKALCEGYARLFKALCDIAGLESVVITGYARDKYKTTSLKFKSNHCWNAVKADGAWHLMDLTWGSGFVNNSNGQFVANYDPDYFFMDAMRFSASHFPDDLRWTLLPTPVTVPEFRYAPFKPRSFSKYRITGFFPQEGIIETWVGDTIRLELETAAIDRYRTISPDSLWDSVNLAQASIYAYVSPAFVSAGNNVYYNYPVNSESIQWLHVMFNNDAILRYRLHIRKAPAGQ